MGRSRTIVMCNRLRRQPKKRTFRDDDPCRARRPEEAGNGPSTIYRLINTKLTKQQLLPPTAATRLINATALRLRNSCVGGQTAGDPQRRLRETRLHPASPPNRFGGPATKKTPIPARFLHRDEGRRSKPRATSSVPKNRESPTAAARAWSWPSSLAEKIPPAHPTASLFPPWRSPDRQNMEIQPPYPRAGPGRPGLGGGFSQRFRFPLY